MLDNIHSIQEKVDTLIRWVGEMRVLIQNPYINGLNMSKVIEDLGGYAVDLRNDIAQLEKDAEQALTPEIEETATVEQ